MIFVLDNFDSFTYNLVDYLKQAGADCLVRRNTCTLEEIRSLSFQAIVLSPGPGTPAQAGILMELIKEYEQQVPILGICLGHQALGEFYGGKVVKAAKPMHGKLSEVYFEQDFLFERIPARSTVVRYHSLVLEKCPSPLVPLAWTDQKELMGLAHADLPIRGLQFHPEAVLTEGGLQMIKNWVHYYDLHS
ncbi:aminodeoxychorismate/anthranilate synthase component II [Cytophagales bacterium LB-30]|uniref:Aminodeoxychorismate/anthranilate synthase component II n=1 Tax=Shiella aurantiaca TaxID=3058365 RepID=A0ABT8F3K4_9BACT|nr:aminodeoxychorismate/anthranilate synthase component II [Shiella aurantiaca]MDN4164586.1 aminodeoxychorismate/anthranilate synthase component II [Shiella aurantiaca]